MEFGKDKCIKSGLVIVYCKAYNKCTYVVEIMCSRYRNWSKEEIIEKSLNINEFSKDY